jgi:hypothetical protein
MEVRHLRSDELQHHGVKGQKWGVRRYQNYDGSLKNAAKKRYISKTLNSLQRHKADAEFRRDRYTNYSKAIETSIEKAKLKGKDKKVEKKEKVLKKYQELKNTAINEIKQVDSATKKTIDTAIKNNWNVTVKQGAANVMPKTAKDELIISCFTAGFLGGAAVTAGVSSGNAAFTTSVTRSAIASTIVAGVNARNARRTIDTYSIKKKKE